MIEDALGKSFASVGKPRSVLAGLSGGADSVALLVSLCKLKHENSFDLQAVHVNHGLRENAALDERFCIELCKKLAVPLVVKHISVGAASNIEATAREARYAAFNAAMQETQSDILALAHHQDDQAETVIMHLLYGAGASGLAGMRELRENIWRPFLSVRSQQLRDYLKQLGYSWREDESNTDIAFTRNRIRAIAMPALEACADEAVSAIARTALILQSEDDCLNAMADEWLSRFASSSAFPFMLVLPLAKEHPALQRRILRRYAERFSLLLDYQQTERLRCLIVKKVGAAENLPGGWKALKSRERLHLVSPDCKRPDAVICGSLEIRDAESETENHRQILPLEQTRDLELRARKTGDYIQPFGMQGTKTLKEYMIDHSIDRPFRDAWPLVCRGNEVLWVIGVGASEKLRVQMGDPTVKQMIYTGKTPDQI